MLWCILYGLKPVPFIQKRRLFGTAKAVPFQSLIRLITIKP